MTVLSFLGTIVVYGWVILTLILGMMLEAGLVYLCFAEWKYKKSVESFCEDVEASDLPGP